MTTAPEGSETEAVAPAEGEPPQRREGAPDGAPTEATAADGDEATGEVRRRSRGGRGRDRRERSPEGVALEGMVGDAQASAAEPTAFVAAPAAFVAAPAAFDAEPVAAVEPAAAVAFEPAAAPAPVIAPRPVETVAAATGVASQPARVEPFELPMASLQAVAESAGLQWVNSDADKIRAVQAAMAAEPAPVHVPRERKPMPVVDDGPLVLVETRKDLSQVKLPFEIAQSAPPQPGA